MTTESGPVTFLDMEEVIGLAIRSLPDFKPFTNVGEESEIFVEMDCLQVSMTEQPSGFVQLAILITKGITDLGDNTEEWGATWQYMPHIRVLEPGIAPLDMFIFRLTGDPELLFEHGPWLQTIRRMNGLMGGLLFANPKEYWQTRLQAYRPVNGEITPVRPGEVDVQAILRKFVVCVATISLD